MTDLDEAVLDRDQFRSVTLEDEELMREILSALIDDTSRQIGLLESSIGAADGDRTRRLAHYSKGACANVGAKAAATLLQHIERQAAAGNFEGCTTSLEALAAQVEQLRGEAATL
jgi:HPt (histidine-containing phosphotransfer) domain-containing protein